MPNGSERIVLRTIKLKGTISQGLILPYIEGAEIGDNVTHHFDAEKYEKPISFNSTVIGNFHPLIPKTEEERIQNLDYSFGSDEYIFTEKLEKTSCTIVKEGDTYRYYSRNYEVASNSIYAIPVSIPSGYAIQGELIGPNIQGNPYKLDRIKLYVFNVYNPEFQRLNWIQCRKFCRENLLEMVPLWKASLPDTKEELIKLADGNSMINPSVKREGLVIRSQDYTLSFKVISNEYLSGQ